MTTLDPSRIATGPSWSSLPRHTLAMVRRNLLHLRRMPEMLMDATAQPIILVLMFAYVFGGAIQPTGATHGYRDWLLAGIMGQTIAWGSSAVAVGLASDIQSGAVERVRSLPVARSILLLGRSISGLIHAVIGLTVMSLTGLVIGWRIRGSLGDAVLGYALLLLWALAMIWIGILVGSALRSVEAVNGLMLTAVFPITFVANTYAPPDSMPKVLQVVAEWNPISSLVQAVRELWGNAQPAAADAAFPLRHPIESTIVWSLVIVAVMAPLALRAFNRAKTR